MDNNYPHNLPRESDFIVNEENTLPLENETKETDPPADKKTLVQTGLYVFAIIGIVATLAFGAWGGVRIARVAPETLLAAIQSVTSRFIPADTAEPILFTLGNHNIEHRDVFNLSWVHNTKQDGTYSFRYECVPGVALSYIEEDTQTPLSCNEAFTVPTGEKVLTLSAESTERRFVDVPISITFTPTNQDVADTQEAFSLLTVINTGISGSSLSAESKAAVPPSTGGNTVQTSGAPHSETRILSGGTNTTLVRVSNPNGTPDLFVTVIATGVVDKVTNTLLPNQPVAQGERAAVRFQVINVGTKMSGPWSFIADLPISSGTYVYRPGETQRSLYPGERIEYTLGFDGITRASTSAMVVINVDTEHAVAETNRTNNTAEAVISVVTTQTN